MDTYILDIADKKVFTYENYDSFVYEFNNIENIEITRKDSNTKKVVVRKNDETSFTIELNKLNQIVKYINSKTKNKKRGFNDCDNVPLGLRRWF